MHFTCIEGMHAVKIIFRNLFLKNTEINFAFFRVDTGYSVIDPSFLMPFGSENK